MNTKNRTRWLRLLPIAAALCLALLASPVMARGPGGGGMGGGGGGSGGGGGAGTTLTTAETYWLTYMREEEKLARDTYLEMYAMYGSYVFTKIASSEQNHMDAIKTLLDRYGVADPAAGNGRGEFTNSHLQDLYQQLIDKGRLSLTDAYEVGVIVEETDIADLEQAIAAAAHGDISNVYSNLLQGSFHHLSAFQSRLSN